MLARRYRLTKQDHVPGILKGGTLRRNPHFVLRFRPNRRSHPRFSVIVSQKVRPNAVDRNRLRRQAYEILRKLLTQQPELAATNTDFLLLPQKTIPELPYLILENSIQSLFKGLSHPSTLRA